MKLQKIIQIIIAIVGVTSLFFLFSIIRTGDEEIKLLAAQGNYNTISPLFTIAIVIFDISVLLILLFSFKDVFFNPQKLKKSLLWIGLFGVVVLVSYLASTGVETPLKDGEILSANASRWVGAGLRIFYCLAAIAIGSMLFFGIKKIIFNK